MTCPSVGLSVSPPRDEQQLETLALFKTNCSAHMKTIRKVTDADIAFKAFYQPLNLISITMHTLCYKQGQRAAQTSGTSTPILSPTEECVTNRNSFCHVSLKFKHLCIDMQLNCFLMKLSDF